MDIHNLHTTRDDLTLRMSIHNPSTIVNTHTDLASSKAERLVIGSYATTFQICKVVAHE